MLLIIGFAEVLWNVPSLNMMPGRLDGDALGSVCGSVRLPLLSKAQYLLGSGPPSLYVVI